MVQRIEDTRDVTWMLYAACRGQDPIVYDTDDEDKPSSDVRCFLCPVRAECLTYALAGRESGTWGGMSRKQRDRVVKRKRKHRTCPDPMCKSRDIYNRYGVGSCVACGVSWYTKPQAKTSLNPVGV